MFRKSFIIFILCICTLIYGCKSNNSVATTKADETFPPEEITASTAPNETLADTLPPVTEDSTMIETETVDTPPESYANTETYPTNSQILEPTDTEPPATTESLFNAGEF